MTRFQENTKSALVLVAALLLLAAYVFWPASAHIPHTVQFGGVSLTIDIATTTAAQELGLGGREKIASDYGLLFVFQKPDYYGFWMKDMRFPIDIFWLNAQGQVVTIARGVATSTYPDVFYPTAPAVYVLETISGFAEAHSIATGTPLELKNITNVSK